LRQRLGIPANMPKHLAKDKKQRAVKRQGCCGLFAILYALGIPVKTAQDIEKYRRICIEQKLVHLRSKEWMGGTTMVDRERILRYFGGRGEYHDFKAKTLGKLLKEKSIFQTKSRWLVTVTGHVLFMQTNMSKKKLYLVDQRGTRMSMDSPALKRNLKQKVKHVLRVYSKHS